MSRYFVICLIFTLAAAVFAGPVEDLEPGHWYEVPNSKMSALDPCPQRGCTYSGIVGQTAVMDAWCGGAFDTKRNRLIVFGGGHNDYWGNEMYVFDVDSLKWLRLTNPYPEATAAACPGDEFWPDNSPCVHHTYNMVEYAPNADAFLYFWSGLTPSAFNFTTNRWDMGGASADIGHTTGRVSAYDPATGHAWVHGTYGSGRLGEYDPINDTWTLHGSASYLEIYGTAAVDPDRRLMVLTGGYGGNRQFRVWNLATGARVPTPATSGATDLETSGCVGFVFDPIIKRFVGWKGGTHVFVLNPDTWVWTRVEAAPSNTVTPTAANSRGTYGRFRYMPDYNAYIVVNKTTENVFIYKLPSGVTGMDKKTARRTLNLKAAYANPFLSSLRVFGHEKDRFFAYDLKGRRLGEYRGGRIGWDLPAGVYVARMHGNDKSVWKFVKTR